jgi:hypothetical protein
MSRICKNIPKAVASGQMTRCCAPDGGMELHTSTQSSFIALFRIKEARSSNYSILSLPSYCTFPLSTRFHRNCRSLIYHPGACLCESLRIQVGICVSTILRGMQSYNLQSKLFPWSRSFSRSCRSRSWLGNSSH